MSHNKFHGLAAPAAERIRAAVQAVRGSVTVEECEPSGLMRMTVAPGDSTQYTIAMPAGGEFATAWVGSWSDRQSGVLAVLTTFRGDRALRHHMLDHSHQVLVWLLDLALYLDGHRLPDAWK